MNTLAVPKQGWLILWREFEERIVLGDDVEVFFERSSVDWKNRRIARLQVSAPAAITILRTELMTAQRDLGHVSGRGLSVARGQPGRLRSRLHLTRHTEQGFFIGNDVQIHVVAIRPDCVRLGVMSPRDVRIRKGEIYDRQIEEERVAARAASPYDPLTRSAQAVHEAPFARTA